MNIKEKFGDAAKRVKEYDYKKLLGTKAFITVGCIVLICVAVLVSTLVNGGEPNTAGAEESGRILGNALLVDASANASSETSETGALEGDDFLAMSIINRTQVRDSALEVLREIAENPDALPDAKEDALASIAEIADDMSAEANIETLVKAKGIAECVAVISGGSCSVIVDASDLLPDELAQITEIVYEQTGITVANIKVLEADTEE